jgi:hypothetical protein
VKRALAVAAVMLTIWVAHDFTRKVRHDLREFDVDEVARIETAMWRSYYEHHRVRLFAELTTLLREQFDLPFWRSCRAAYYAARSAVIFQRGRERAEYLRALPPLVDYYEVIRRASSTPFDPQRVAELELEWWILHRERERHAPADLERGLAELQAAIFNRPASEFAAHARYRAQAMLLRDSGGDWRKIAELLEQSWGALHDVVNSPQPL